MITAWIKGISKRRWGRLLASACGVAITVSLVASIGTFISTSGASMTKRAIEDIPVDWQVQTVPGADINAIKAAIGKTTAFTAMEQVGYADVTGFSAATGGTTQTTGAGKVLGVSDNYGKVYGGEFRQLIGAAKGVLVAQQTAANLHVTVGDTVSIMRTGLPPATVKVDGVVDLPNADSLFQAIGLPSGAAPQAPPDNVLILPEKLWHSLFDEQASVRPDSVRTQLHVKIDHNFSSDPNIACSFVKGEANNLEASIAGSGIVGDNLATRLSAARSDALYAQVLFLFLGLPGVTLAIVLTLMIAASGAKHRRQEQTILRTYGASANQIIKLQALEAFVTAALGIVLGVVLTVTTNSIFIRDAGLFSRTIAGWIAAAAVIGLIVALVSVLYPAWNTAKHTTVSSAKTVRITKIPLWRKLYVDVILLVISVIEFLRTASSGYQIVLAPEGVSAVSVNYESFIAPFCLWIGGVLLVVRLCGIFMERGKGALTFFIKPLAKKLSGIIAASLTREKGHIIKGVVLVALAVSFAVSTSLFNTTYNAQAKVDAQLTNGSDVTVTTTVPLTQNDGRITRLESLPGVAGIQLMQHRYAFVGNDLQDIYGIDPKTISQATNISDAFFQNGNAKETLSMLAKTPDGVLVSEETMKDYQLKLGDTINLRLQSKADNSYHVIPFHFLGVVRKFPTAPSDSFLVANSDYISGVTQNSSYEVVLMRASSSPSALAKQATTALGAVGVQVSDLMSVQKTINSSLTSVDLHGLTSIELIYAVLLVIGALGLVLGLGMAERRRNFAILKAVGAKDKQLHAFIWSEGLFVFVSGGLIGTLVGFEIAQMLVKVLTGIFDPPPAFMSIPWGYLAVLLTASLVSTISAISIIKLLSKRPAVEELRNLSN